MERRHTLSCQRTRALFCALTGVLALLASVPCVAATGDPGAGNGVGPVVAESAPSNVPVDLSTAIIRVARKTIPAVVHIEVTERQRVQNPFYFFQSDPFFGQFFGDRRAPREFQREVKALGTGMIIDRQGHILTNNHVVAGATKIQITLANGDEYPGKVVGTDPKTDLAIVEIPPQADLPYVVFGDSDKVEVGQWVVAIGHPRGLDQTVTQGIISAKHREGITDPSSYQDFLQTDAPINPGNSGGPLLTLQGQVIGVNAAIATESGGSEGLGFSIPSNMAVHVARQLIAHGKVERGWLGVSVQDVTPKLARAFNLPAPAGALIADVVKGGPADKAGLKRGDVVVAFGDREVHDAGMLRNDAATAAIGRDVTVTVLRKGKKMEFTVKMGDFQSAVEMMVASVKERLGATVRPVTPQEANKYGMQSARGVAIRSVEPNGPLGSVGLEVDDLILAVNGDPVGSVEDFASMVESLRSGARVNLLVLDHRTGQTGTLQAVVR